MGMKSRSSGAPGLAGRRHAIDAEPRVSLSLLIWVVLAILTALLIFTGIGMFQARGALEETNAALARAEDRVKQSGLALKHALEQKEQALADKRQVIKELSAQGNRLAEFSQGEEKAKSALAAASTGSQAAERRIKGLTGKIADLKKSLAAARRGESEHQSKVLALETSLGIMNGQLENIQAELNSFRSAAEPYRAP